MNPIALRLHETGLILEGTNQHEFMSVCGIAEREIIRLDELVAALKQQHRAEIAICDDKIYATLRQVDELKQRHAQDIESVKRVYLSDLNEARNEALDAAEHRIEALKQQHAEEIERLKAETADGIQGFAHANDEMRKQAGRYEKLRRLNVEQFKCLFLENLKGPHVFDYLVDQLPGSGDSGERKPKCDACQKPLRLTARGERGAIYSVCDCGASADEQANRTE